MVFNRHQETALNFMSQREFGPIPPEFSLWNHERNVRSFMYVRVTLSLIIVVNRYRHADTDIS